MSNAAKNFNIPIGSLNILHNYFDSSTKLFLVLYLVKYLDYSEIIFSVFFI